MAKNKGKHNMNTSTETETETETIETVIEVGDNQITDTSIEIAAMDETVIIGENITETTSIDDDLAADLAKLDAAAEVAIAETAPTVSDAGETKRKPGRPKSSTTTAAPAAKAGDDKLWTSAGISLKHGIPVYRFNNGTAASRTAVLNRCKVQGVQLFDLPEPMNKAQAIEWLKTEKGITAEASSANIAGSASVYDTDDSKPAAAAAETLQVDSVTMADDANFLEQAAEEAA